MLLQSGKISIANILIYVIPYFVVSCQTSSEKELESSDPLTLSNEYVRVPVKRVYFEYFDKKNMRITTQDVEYVDGNSMKSVSSVWMFKEFPLEIIVLDNPDINNKLLFEYHESDELTFRSTHVYLPFKETLEMDDLDDFLPTCKGNEFRALARILSRHKYIGLPKEQNDLSFDYRPWFSMGEVICMSLVKD